MSFIYAETAFHHQGDMEYILGLVNAAERAAADGVKFQVLLDYDSFISRQNPGYDSFKKALFSEEEWVRIFEHCTSKGLKIILMPCDPRTMDLVIDGTFKPDFLDLHSVSFFDAKVLERMKQTGIPVIVGTGGRYLDEIKEKVEFFGSQLWCLMFGFQGFPTHTRDLHIEKITTLKIAFPDTKIGYADHSHFGSSEAIYSNLQAHELGATVFEKHLTLTEGEERFDHISSVSERKFAAVVQKLRALNPVKVDNDLSQGFPLSGAELTYRSRERFAVAKSDLIKGHTIMADDLNFKMTGQEEGVNDGSSLVGKKLKSDIAFDHTITMNDVE